ncbi:MULTISPECIES: thermonuclease family protein [unclassified Roseitalea]|uniref:thermonuclease family protein n=1 Tax=unclassified Roseitalea TaxID=2639107 RepID=UPI00273E4093|nr:MULTISPECIES: thermonuclease family protein [unclassified Roseitalea]
MAAGRHRRRRGRTLADLIVAAAVLAATAAAAVVVQEAGSDTVTGTARIGDGDSLAVAGVRVRLRGIDAPEREQTCIAADDRTVPCGRLAMDHLAALIGTGDVRCKGHERDRFDRLLGVCRSDDAPEGETLNAAMVEAGWAVAFGDYGRQETQARRAGRGLWALEFERPSDWRAQNDPRHAAAGLEPRSLLRRARGWLGLGGHHE